MAGPPEATPLAVVIPPGEAQQLYSPELLAWKVENFRWHPDGYLASVLGPAPYEPNRGEGYPTLSGVTYGIFHAALQGGTASTLLVRSGRYLFRHRGWGRSYQNLSNHNGDGTLTEDSRPRFPDQWVALGDRVIWTNGADQPRVIGPDGMIVPLGLSVAPAPPSALGPAQPNQEARNTRLPNSYGYCAPGRIGTLGDTLDAVSGSILAGTWDYAAQEEDIFGNLGPISPRSNDVNIFTQQAQVLSDDPGIFGSALANNEVQLDDLLRMFAVRLGDAGARGKHIAATWLLRTKDKPRMGPQLYRVGRFPGRHVTVVPDSKSDGELGGVPRDNVAVAPFRVMCAHAGCLVAGNWESDPGIVRKSDPGFHGTFGKDSWVYPDSGGAETTAVASHGGRLLAFTERAVYDITDFSAPVSLARGIGCVAPRSIQALPDGRLIWLSQSGFYAMAPGEMPVPLSGATSRLLTYDVNRARMRLAVSAIDVWTGEYLCAVCPAGQQLQTMLLRFDGRVWKRCDYGISITDICVTDDYRGVTLFSGYDATNAVAGVWVLDHEIDPVFYSPPSRLAVYRSGWIRGDPTAMQRLFVRELRIALVDGDDANATITFYRDGSWTPLGTASLATLGRDDGSGLVGDIAGVAVIGTSKFHERRIKWRRVSCSPYLNGVRTWAFRITSASRLNLASFSFMISQSTAGDAGGDIPWTTDV